MRVTARVRGQEPTDPQKNALHAFLSEYLFATPGGTQVEVRYDVDADTTRVEVVFDHEYVDIQDFNTFVTSLSEEWQVDCEFNEYYLSTDPLGHKLKAVVPSEGRADG